MKKNGKSAWTVLIDDWGAAPRSLSSDGDFVDVRGNGFTLCPPRAGDRLRRRVNKEQEQTISLFPETRTRGKGGRK